MTSYAIHTIDSAPAASKAGLHGVKQSLGFIPNLFATMAGSPEALNGYLALEGILANGTLSGAERQLLLVTISTENECTYCAAAHSTLAQMMRAPSDAIAAARDDVPQSDTRLQALFTFTRAVMRARGKIGEEALSDFYSAGFTRAQAMEVAANIGLKTISNYIDGFAHLPLDEAFAPQSWAPAAEAR